MIKIDISGDKAIQETFKQFIPKVQKQALAKLGAAIHDDVKERIGKHTKSGALEQSLRVIKSDSEFVIYNDLQRAPYAKYVHWPTRPHLIKAKNKKALKFVGKDGKPWMFFGPKSPQEQALIRKWRDKKAFGTRLFFKWPMHPGWRGDPWYRDAAAEAPALFARIVQQLQKELR